MVSKACARLGSRCVAESLGSGWGLVFFWKEASLSAERTSLRTSAPRAAWFRARGRCSAETGRLCCAGSASTRTPDRGHLVCSGRGLSRSRSLYLHLSEWFTSLTKEGRWGKPVYKFVCKHVIPRHGRWPGGSIALYAGWYPAMCGHACGRVRVFSLKKP